MLLKRRTENKERGRSTAKRKGKSKLDVSPVHSTITHSSFCLHFSTSRGQEAGRNGGEYSEVDCEQSLSKLGRTGESEMAERETGERLWMKRF